MIPKDVRIEVEALTVEIDAISTKQKLLRIETEALILERRLKSVQIELYNMERHYEEEPHLIGKEDAIFLKESIELLKKELKRVEDKFYTDGKIDIGKLLVLYPQ